MAASIGEEALVPPTSFQPPLPLEVSYTATPVVGSASAATSLSIRLEQPDRLSAACQDGCGSTAEQPDPAPGRQCGAPHRLAPAARVGGRAQPGAADRDDIWRGRRVDHAEAGVARRGGDHVTRVVEVRGVERGIRGRLGPAPGVGDVPGHARGGVLRGK